MTSGLLGELTRGRHVLPICTRAWIHSAGGPCIRVYALKSNLLACYK